MQIHPDDWAIWQEIVQSLKDGQRPNIASSRRKRALLAISKTVNALKENQQIEIKA
jgi:hypothetical protein